MVHAFVMVETAAGSAERLLDSLESVEGVDDAHIVAGNYDIIAEVEATEVYEILETVSNEFHGLEGVTDTKTYIAMA